MHIRRASLTRWTQFQRSDSVLSHESKYRGVRGVRKERIKWARGGLAWSARLQEDGRETKAGRRIGAEGERERETGERIETRHSIARPVSGANQFRCIQKSRSTKPVAHRRSANGDTHPPYERAYARARAVTERVRDVRARRGFERYTHRVLLSRVLYAPWKSGYKVNHTANKTGPAARIAWS